ncbi:MAG: phosphoglycerate dehydrogenase [Chloroflexota bacterium]
MRVLVADPVAEEGIALLGQYAEVDIKLGLSQEELRSIIGDYEALVVRSETKVPASVIEKGTRLLVIGRAGTGVDNIDVGAATRKGVVVVNAPTGNTVSAAEHTIALMLALARHIPQAHASLRAGQWRRKDFMGVEVKGKVLGVVGLGNVGSEVARRAKGLEMQVIGHDPFVSPEYARNLGVELVGLNELLQKADFVTLHLPLTSETKMLLGPKELALLKPTARLINCARGGLVDERVLYEMVESGGIAGAAVDVFSQEPACDNILCGSDKVIVTPHLAASTAEAQTLVAVDVAQQVVEVLQGRSARYAVNAPLIPAEKFGVLAPFVQVASAVGRLASQLIDGQMKALLIKYDGEVASFETSALKAAVIRGLLEGATEERVNLVNASIIAAQRGLSVIEQKGGVSENYAGLLTVEVTTSEGVTVAAGTVFRGEPHIVRVNSYWLDIVPTGGYFLFADHRDRPGLIGAVGNVTGKADINISSMLVSRLQPRGQALMILGLDEPLREEQLQEILAIPGVKTAKMVKL